MEMTNIVSALIFILIFKPKKKLMQCIEIQKNGTKWQSKVLHILESFQVIDALMSIAETFGRLNLSQSPNLQLMQMPELEVQLI